MTSTILRHTNPLTVPQMEQQEGLVQNNAGGYVHGVDVWTQLNRFLTIGTEGGTYYVNERDHTLDNVKVVDKALAEDFKRAIDMATEISVAGRAPKNDYALYVIAKGAADSDVRVRQYALQQLQSVARTGTHLFQFVAMVDSLRGWGTALREAIANWYTEKNAKQLAYQVTKYQQREGWSHRDVLRKAHPQTNDLAMNAIFKYIVSGALPTDTLQGFTMDEHQNTGLLHIEAVEAAKKASASATVDLIRDFGLTREMVNTEYLTDATVLRALSEKMPYTALIRNLGNLTKARVIALLSTTTTRIAAQISDLENVKRSRIHPIQLLYALRTYQHGAGFRGDRTWNPQHEIVEALETAFYLSFGNVESTGKRTMLALDVSGSMGQVAGNGPLTCAEVSAAMLMATLRTEGDVLPMAFNDGISPLKVNKNMSLEEVLRVTSHWTGGATDCAAPMRYALENGLDVDTFVVYTDNETWAGRGSPSDWLKEYRRKTGIDAKLVVVGITATPFSIADKNDAGMLDVAGFDSAVPMVISSFARGDL